MTVLVMGATGNVVGAIVQELREREVAVTAVSRHEGLDASATRMFTGSVRPPEGRLSIRWKLH